MTQGNSIDLGGIGMSSVNLLILGILSAGLRHGSLSRLSRGPIEMNPEQRLEFSALALDGGLCSPSSPAGYRLAVAEWASLTESPYRVWHGLDSLVAFDRGRVPSPRMVSLADVWLHNLFPTMSAARGQSRLEEALGLHPADTLSATVVLSLIHLWGIRQAFVHHWAYRAEPGDTVTEIAVATGQSPATVARDNPQHGSMLSVGQRVRWSLPVMPSAPQPPKPVIPEPMPIPKPSSGRRTPVPAPTTPVTGVFADLNPLAGLVLMNPSARCLRTVLRVDPATEPISVAVEAQWALLHQQLVAEWVARGHSLAVDGYSTTALAGLPLAAVSQELGWSEAVVRRITGVGQPAVVVLPTAAARVVSVVQNQRIPWITPRAKVSAAGGRRWSAIVIRQLLAHPNQLVAVSSPGGSGTWPKLFGDIRRHRIILETLTQIWTAP